MLLEGMSRIEPLEDFGRRVRARIKQETHLTVGVGIAPTKTLAKLANHAAKKWSKTGGVLDLSNIDRTKEANGSCASRRRLGRWPSNQQEA